MLSDQFMRLRRSLSRVLRDNYDPVTHTFDAVVDAQADEIARKGEEHRRKRLGAIRALVGKLDGSLERTEPDVGRASEIPPTPDTNVRQIGGGIFDDLGQ